MDERIIQFRVGVVVIAAFLVAGTLVLWFGEGVRGSYSIYLKFSQADVAIDTPVRKNGVLIGRITRVDLLDDEVLLTAKIDEGRILRNNDVPRLASVSLLGDPVVEFIRKSKRDIPDEIIEIKAGDVVDGIVAGNPMEVFQLVVNMEGKIDAALSSIEAAGNKIGNLTDGLTSVVHDNEGQLKTVLANSNEALEHFNTAMANMNGVLGNEELKGKLMQTLAELPTMFRVAHETLADARGALAAFERVSQRAERNLKNLEGLTEPLGEQGEELVMVIQRSLGNVELLVTQLVAFSQALSDKEGSLAKFAHDPELYNRVSQAAKNIEEVSRKLRPIMSDARILADKLARDPSQLGLRGALSRQRPGEGAKYPFLGTRPWEKKEPSESIRY